MRRFFSGTAFVFTFFAAFFSMHHFNKYFNIDLFGWKIFLEYVGFWMAWIIPINSAFFKGEIFEDMKPASERVEAENVELWEENKTLKNELKSLKVEIEMLKNASKEDVKYSQK